MKKIIVVAFLVTGAISLTAQVNVNPTDSFSIGGEIKNPQVITLSALGAFHTASLNDVASLNHMGQVRGTMKNAKGVLLRDILQKIELNIASPKLLYGFYVECVATDGYKTVFSWNEILNTANGENVYVITERDGKKIAELDDRITILQLYAPGRGHVYIKGLREMIIQSVK
jgi:hypothetical protein